MRRTCRAVSAVLFLAVFAMGCVHHRKTPGSEFSPKQQAERFFAAGKTMDWKTLHGIAEGASKYRSADEYAAEMKKALNGPVLGVVYFGTFTSLNIELATL